jgi:hypothetical protein
MYYSELRKYLNLSQKLNLELNIVKITQHNTLHRLVKKAF